MLEGMGYEKVTGVFAEPLHSRYRDEFPVRRNLIYLNHAAVAPLSGPAARAMKNLTDDVCCFGLLHYDKWMEAYAGLRTAAAKLINASPGEIAIVKNTSEGISTVAEGLHWNRGDKVIVFEEEFPANYYPWLRLERRGVELKALSIYDPIEKIAKEIEGARLLAISFVNYLSGFRVDLRRIGELCSRHGCFFFVDAIQGMGAFPIDVEACHVDALSADGHKWMLGPEGNGVLYVRQTWLDSIEPVEFGWTNSVNYADYSARGMTPRLDAGRYECGTLNTIGCFGLRAAIEFLLEIGIDNIATAIRSLADQLEASVRARGYEMITRRTHETGSGIVTFRHPSIDSQSIVSDLERNRIVATWRQGWIRMSPHFYISPEDLEQVADMLPAV
jgi:cysteine desulfurase / selenocysteine lyase